MPAHAIALGDHLPLGHDVGHGDVRLGQLAVGVEVLLGDLAASDHRDLHGGAHGPRRLAESSASPATSTRRSAAWPSPKVCPPPPGAASMRSTARTISRGLVPASAFAPATTVS